MSDSPRMRVRRGYASGLDGIRAIAVILVIGYHAGVPALRGGFVGVDLFFVVSGYLVTALLQQEFDLSGRIRFLAFYRRRAKRLLPALLVMLTIVSAATWLAGRDLGVGLRSQLAGAFTFSSNWIQISDGSSYVTGAEPAILTHLWSLAVEEQFYLVWPAVCLLLLTRLRVSRQRVRMIVSVAAVSALVMAVTFTAGADPTRAYVGTDSHGFGLLLGAALALLRPPSKLDPMQSRRPSARRGAAAMVGPVALLIVFAGAGLLTDNGWPTYRGGLLAVNVAAVILVAATVRGSGVMPSLLSLRVLRWVGQRSYALYLWHWPALVIDERLLRPSIGHNLSAVIAIVGALLAADVSWRLVERPIRRFGVVGYLTSLGHQRSGRSVRSRRRTARWAAAGAFAVVLGVAACGVVTAPRQSELALSLAAGEQALREESAAQSLAQSSARSPAGSSPSMRAPVSPEVTVSSPAAVAAVAPVVLVAPTTGADPQTTTAAPRTASRTPESSRTRVTSSSTIRSRLPAMPGTLPSTSLSHPAARPTSTATRPPITGEQISGIGDSVMLASAPALLARFPGADIDAVVSRQLWDLGSLVGDELGHGRMRPYLVVGLGTNGTDAVEHIEKAIGELPAAEVVVLVNSYVPHGWQDQANANLNMAAAARPHTCVADWHAAIGAHRDLLGVDGVHPAADGGRLYASVIAAALERCH